MPGRQIRTWAFLAVWLIQSFSGSGFLVRPEQAADNRAVDSNQSLDVPFSQMRFNGKTFTGVYDSAEIWFRMPVDWTLISGSKLTLIYTVSISESDNPYPAGTNLGMVYITMNYVRIAVVPITKSGDYQIEVPVSLSISPQLNTGYNVVGITFMNELQCEAENGVSVFVDPKSFLTLTYVIQTSAPRLSNLPGPFSLPGLVIPAEETALIIPSNPTAVDLQSALTVAASLGSLSNGQGSLRLLTADSVTDSIKETSHLILVGTSASLPLLADLELLAPLHLGEFAKSGSITGEDGVIQLVNSPWNSSLAVLVISGDTNEAVARAASSLRTELKVATGYRGLAVIPAAGQEQMSTAAPTPDLADNFAVPHTFLDLGYQDVVLSGVGTFSTDYHFVVPNGFQPGKGAGLDMVLSNSSRLDPERTLMTVRLNNFPVYSARIGAQETGDRKIHIDLDPSMLLTGRNLLSVELTMSPINICDNRMNQYGGWTDANLWSVTIRKESSLIIPLADETIAPSTKTRVRTLADYPDNFISSASLDDLTFLLVREDFSSWNTAIDLAFSLGAKSNFSKAEKSPLSLRAAFLDETTASSGLEGQNILMFGTNAELSSYIPEGQNQIMDYDTPVVYGVLDNTPLGYVDVLPSAWDEQYSMLLVRGNTAAGLDLATDALQSGGDGFLSGSSLVTNGTQIFYTQP